MKPFSHYCDPHF